MAWTDKKEGFSQGIARGLNQSDAYRAAFNASRMKPETIHKRASELMRDREVAGRIAGLKADLAEKALWEREDSVKELSAIARDAETARPSERVAAIKELNAMHGYNAPQKIDHLSSDGSMTPAAPLTPAAIKAISKQLDDEC